MALNWKFQGRLSFLLASVKNLRNQRHLNEDIFFKIEIWFIIFKIC